MTGPLMPEDTRVVAALKGSNGSGSPNQRGCRKPGNLRVWWCLRYSTEPRTVLCVDLTEKMLLGSSKVFRIAS